MGKYEASNWHTQERVKRFRHGVLLDPLLHLQQKGLKMNIDLALMIMFSVGAFIGFAIGYSKGHEHGKIQGKIIARRLIKAQTQHQVSR